MNDINNIENMIYEINDDKRKIKKVFNLLLKYDKITYEIDNNNNAYFKILKCKDYINKEIEKIINKKEKQKNLKKLLKENEKKKLEFLKNEKPKKENHNKNKKSLILYFD